MSSDSKILKFVVITFLILHTLWLVNHLRWVATKQVNPWKLGGYGMYTVPPPSVSLALLDLRNPAGVRRIDPRTYSLKRFWALTPSRAFRCSHVKSKELKAFFEENPQLRGNNLGFLFMEDLFIHDPVSVKRVRQGRVSVIWISRSFFDFTSEFCGSHETGRVAL